MTAIHNIRPVPARGGKVLRRALMSALNLVPGTFGRYKVERCGPEAAILTERLTAAQLPLCVLIPGAVLWPVCPVSLRYYSRPAVPTAAEIEAGWPLKRQGAILRLLTGNPEINVGYSINHEVGVIYKGFPEGLIPPSGVVALTGYTLGLTGQTVTGLWSNASVPLTLAPAVVTGTYIGQRSATIRNVDRPLRARLTLLARTNGCLSEWHERMGSATRGRLWSRALRAGYPPEATTGAEPDALAEIGLVPEIWNHTTDPGGEGSEAGRGDAETVSREEYCDHCGPDGDWCDACQAEGECSECHRSL